MTTSSVFSVYLTGHEKRDGYLKAFAKGAGSKAYEPGATSRGGVAVSWGLQENLGRLLACKAENLPFVFLDHAYFNRGYEHNARVCVNGVHQNLLLDVPEDRKKMFGVEALPWRRGREILVIVPSERVCLVLGVSKFWAQEKAKELKKYTDRPIRLKFKGDGLLGELRDCHAVVSLASVAEVEAVKYGVPAFTSRWSPASQVAERDFSKIESPIYPDREMWLRTLAYSTWSAGELADGTTTRHLQRVLNGELLNAGDSCWIRPGPPSNDARGSGGLHQHGPDHSGDEGRS